MRGLFVRGGLRSELAGGFLPDRGMPAFLTPGTLDAWLDPAKLAGTAKTDMLSMLDHTSADMAATIREHVVDRKVSNSRAVDRLHPTVLTPVS